MIDDLKLAVIHSRIESMNNGTVESEAETKKIAGFRTLSPEMIPGCGRCRYLEKFSYFKACSILKVLTRSNFLCLLFSSNGYVLFSPYFGVKSASNENILNDKYCQKCSFSFHDINFTLQCRFYDRAVRPKGICQAFDPAVKALNFIRRQK